MRCASYSTASAYNLDKIKRLSLESFSTNSYQDAIHVYNENRNYFVFEYGCVVFWNFSEVEEKNILKNLEAICVNPSKHDFDIFEYQLKDAQSMHQDLITLDRSLPLTLQMLAVSYGISQSQALAYFETKINTQITQTEFISKKVRDTGVIPLTRKEIFKKMGEIIVLRNSVNLHTDILDTPTFIWDHSEYDHLYNLALIDTEFKARIEVLNRRMSILKELFEIMGDEVRNRHSINLEWIIILLIAFEVILTLLKDVFKII